ncbi:MAG: DUF4390 domain-containing protein [Nitrospirae bacterium]|nr:MAG: DUF4390 domain-containing protein [Nitrospirota bacterium]
MRFAGKLTRYAQSLFFYRLIFAVWTVIIASGPAFPAEIPDVNIRIAGNELYVSASLNLDNKTLEDIDKGISKELVFHIDLFRVWEAWPDEFVTGRKIIKALKINPIKREFTGSSIDGNLHTEKRFRDISSMLAWATSITELKLTNFKELEPGIYFIKLTAESFLRKMPPVINYMVFFTPEKEFSVSKNSATFSLNKAAAQ